MANQLPSTQRESTHNRAPTTLIAPTPWLPSAKTPPLNTNNPPSSTNSLPLNTSNPLLNTLKYVQHFPGLLSHFWTNLCVFVQYQAPVAATPAPVSQYNPVYPQQYAPASQSQYSSDVQQRLDRGEYIGDGDYRGEGLAEALAPGYAGESLDRIIRMM